MLRIPVYKKNADFLETDQLNFSLEGEQFLEQNIITQKKNKRLQKEQQTLSGDEC